MHCMQNYYFTALSLLFFLLLAIDVKVSRPLLPDHCFQLGSTLAIVGPKVQYSFYFNKIISYDSTHTVSTCRLQEIYNVQHFAHCHPNRMKAEQQVVLVKGIKFETVRKLP